MIKIVNISDIDSPLVGLNHYELRINDRVMTTFEHVRKVNGLASCLRDAADAMEVKVAEDAARFDESILAQLAQMHTGNLPAKPTKNKIKAAKKEADRPPASPSEVLFDYFAEHGIHPNEAAAKMEISPSTLLRISSTNQISVKVAARLEACFKISARRLLHIEAQYKDYLLSRELERLSERSPSLKED